MYQNTVNAYYHISLDIDQTLFLYLKYIYDFDMKLHSLKSSQRGTRVIKDSKHEIRL